MNPDLIAIGASHIGRQQRWDEKWRMVDNFLYKDKLDSHNLVNINNFEKNSL